MKYFFPYNIYSKEILLCINFSVWNLFYGIYFFRCNGNFIIHMEKILHEIDSIWKNYYIIKFPWNKYYAGTNISSQTNCYTRNFLGQRFELLKCLYFSVKLHNCGHLNILYQCIWLSENKDIQCVLIIIRPQITLSGVRMTLAFSSLIDVQL
jgi:hypothetical protein